MEKNAEVILKNREGKSYWVLGDLYTFKVTGKETGGAFTVMDQVIQPQGGPPPHIHLREDEAFFISEGRFMFMCAGKETVLEDGGFVYVPKGTLHTFKNISDRPGRLVVTISPAGLEDFFYAIGTEARAGETHPPPFDPSVIDRIMRLAGEYNMEVKVPG